MTPAERALQRLAGLPVEVVQQAKYDWRGLWLALRPEQDPLWEIDWRVRLFMSGRGWGKTRCGAEAVREAAETGMFRNIGLISQSLDEARRVMIEGPSGILSCCPPWARPHWVPANRQMTWPNGTKAIIYSAHMPKQLRGPNFDLVWADELAAWTRLSQRDDNPWDMLQMATRLDLPGTKSTRIIVTTTPRPSPRLREIVENPSTLTTGGSTYDNPFLDQAAVEELRHQFEGTSLGRQELYAELLDEVEGALWTRKTLDDTRSSMDEEPAVHDGMAERRRVVVGVDPGGDASGKTGIIVACRKDDGDIYVLADRTTDGTPAKWAAAAVNAYHEWSAGLIVAEKNQGQEMVRYTIHTVDPDVPVKLVSAVRSKLDRAQPISALFEQGRAHMAGIFPLLEQELTTYREDESWSPDRLDAMVWACVELIGHGSDDFSVGSHVKLDRRPKRPRL